MSAGRMLQQLCLLWLAGMAMRITILAVPPVIPLIRVDRARTRSTMADRAAMILPIRCVVPR
jgi:hypothetical protein